MDLLKGRWNLCPRANGFFPVFILLTTRLVLSVATASVPVFGGVPIIQENFAWSQNPLQPLSEIEDYEEDYDYKEDEDRTTTPHLTPSVGSSDSREVDGNSKPGFLKLERSLTNVTRVSGENVRLRCEVSGSSPVKFRWFKNEAPVVEEKGRVIIRRYSSSGSIHGSRLRIQQLDTHDTGYYKCEAFNAHHRIDTTSILLVKMSQWDRIPSGSSLSNFPNIEGSLPVFEGHESEHGFCQLYRGNACSKIIGNKSIHVTSRMAQGVIEEKLAAAFTVIATSGNLSRRCIDYAVPALCYQAFPLCDGSTGLPRARHLCREECQMLKGDICRLEYDTAKKTAIFGQDHALPDCNDLPQRDTPEGRDCVHLGLPYIEQVSFDDTCYHGNGEDYRGSVSISASGHKCLHWNHQISVKTSDHPELIGGHNSCRNPGGLEIAPWCFVDSDHARKEFCDIPKCINYLWLYILVPLMALLGLLGLIFGIWCMRKQGNSSKSLVKAVVTRPTQQLEMNNLLPKSNLRAKEFPLTSIRFLQELGEGIFGEVYKAELIEDTKITIVVVKTLRENAIPKLQQEFKQEIELMTDLQHPNITCLLGISTKVEPHCMIFEFMSHNDLHEFLLQHSPCSDVSGSTVDVAANALSTSDFLHLAVQISAGMEYLSFHHYVHRDLAARNCLVGDNLTVKISDFGIAKDIYSCDYYRVQSKPPLPIRWMPPESIQYGKFTTESDVWSFGVVLWEIFTYGLQPFYGYSNREVIDMIRSHKILSCPKDCSPYVYNVMTDCWHEIPSRRPSFTELQVRLQSLQTMMSSQCTLSTSQSSSIQQSSTGPSNVTDYAGINQIPFQKATQSFTNSTGMAPFNRPLPQIPYIPSFQRPVTPPQKNIIFQSPPISCSFISDRKISNI